MQTTVAIAAEPQDSSANFAADTKLPCNPSPPPEIVPAVMESTVVDKNIQLYVHPLLDRRATIVTRYAPNQLIDSPLLQPIFELTNLAYSESHSKSGTMPSGNKRLEHPDEFLRGLGFDSDSFCFVLCWHDNPQPIATIGAHRYTSPVFAADAALGSGKKGTTFVRVQLPANIGPDADIWELKSLAVDVRLQGKGLASHLMRLVDEEVVRRFERGEGRELWMVLTTMKEVNFEFYRRRGFVSDYENVYGEGYMGSERGFTVVHMSKRLV